MKDHPQQPQPTHRVYLLNQDGSVFEQHDHHDEVLAEVQGQTYEMLSGLPYRVESLKADA